MGDKLIWQPEFQGYDFIVYLDKDFAKQMIYSKIKVEKRDNLNKLMTVGLKRLGVDWSNPYTFHSNSGFVSQFYIGRNGVWLSTSHETIEDLLKDDVKSNYISYNSHNVETSKEVFALLYLVDRWVHFSDVLIE